MKKRKDLGLVQRKYVRLKNGNIYKIEKMAAKCSMPGDRRTYRDKNGVIKSYTEQIRYDTFYISEKKENSATYEWFIVEEFEVEKCCDRLFDCLKKGDWVICDKDLDGNTQRYYIDEIVKNKHYEFISCKGHNGNKYIFYPKNLISAYNGIKRSAQFAQLETGGTVRHYRLGWLPVVDVIGGKIVVKYHGHNIIIERSCVIDVQEMD